MPESAQRSDYVAGQVEALHQNLRFLEHVATSPIGLTTDLLSLRQAISLDGAAANRERTAFQDVTSSAQTARSLGLEAAEAAAGAIRLLETLDAGAGRLLTPEWSKRAIMVLDRVVQRLGADARSEQARAIAGLYVIIDPEHTRGSDPIEVARAALRGGAGALQLRDKCRDHGPLLDLARRLAGLCREAGAIFIVNDSAAITRLAGVDGLHVGQTDLSVSDARRILRPGQLVGRSNATAQEAYESEAQAADYVAVGAIYPTDTKQDTRPAGLETLSQVKRSVAIPVIAIGGIKPHNAAAVFEAGADAICVTTAVTEAADPEAAARELVGIASGAQSDVR